MAEVRLERVRKVWPNGHVAVHDATFDVADGELMVLVGPSGCGKSTLLRMIAGLEQISEGALRIGGRVVNDVAPSARDIAMVFQNYALYPHMTVAQNLAFGLKLRGFDKAAVKRRIDAAAETLGLAGMLDKLPRELSGGQRQRVALGRALVREPSVFLLDEPLSNLDAKLRHSVRTEIARLHRRLGATMVYVTHDQVEAMTLGQRIVVLNEGAIQQIDTPMALYERPANLFVAGFLGSPAMNVLRGRLEDDGAGASLRLADGQSLALGRAPGIETGREVALGIRPEHLSPSAGAGALRAQVEAIEPVGNETFVHLRHGDQLLVARVAPERAPATGETVALDVARERLHFFDAESGLRLQAASANPPA
ncbi:MAG: sn-glycerol-3-phosphate ABC transporter ATP-binding protein UgpC [Pseudoxanthomonas sp.]